MLSHIRPIAISTAKRGEASVITIVGPVTAGGGDLLLRAEIAEALYAGERKIVIDFSCLSTLDSSGLGELMRASTAATECQGWMAWAGCPTTMVDVLEITSVKFEHVIFADSVEEACEALDRII